MLDFQRLPSLPDLLAKKSFFLFGPRPTGKSFLVKTQLADRALVIDLLRSDLYLRLSADPGLLEGLIGDRRGAKARSSRSCSTRSIASSRAAACGSCSPAAALGSSSAARPTCWPVARGRLTSTR